jgi:dTDP-4-amino-4,6-dideoxygalactose transaminase
LGYRQGDFPVADAQASNVLSFPCDQHLSREEQDYVIESVREFYGARR